ncbi:ABC transporter ATP-binding protein, partial [Mesorhizobium sp. M4B.F.Ca.ET.172.01.1.1]
AAYLGERVIVLAANPGRVVKDLDMRPFKQEGNRCKREDPSIVAAMADLRTALERAS